MGGAKKFNRSKPVQAQSGSPARKKGELTKKDASVPKNVSAGKECAGTFSASKTVKVSVAAKLEREKSMTTAVSSEIEKAMECDGQITDEENSEGEVFQ